MDSQQPVLQVKNLDISFEGLTGEGQLGGVSDLYATIRAGEILTVAGASGAGKSLLANALLGILPSNARVKGSMHFKGEPLTDTRIRELRGKEIAYIPQSVSALNPLMKIGTQAGKEACKLFARYGLDKEVEGMYPYQLSGGMARRVLIAGAAGTGASLIVADEPTSGLNDELAHQIMTHLRELADEGRSILLITHDVHLAAQYSDYIAIIEDGKTIELLSVDDLKAGKAQEPFTRMLWATLPEHEFMNALPKKEAD